MKELPSGWASAPVSAVLRIKYGEGLPARNRIGQGSVPVYASSGRVGHHSSSLVDGPVIIIGRKGAVGSTHLELGACWPIDTVFYAQIPDELSAKYLAYQLLFMRLSRLDRSTAVPSLRREDLEAQLVLVAPLAEQHRIVAAVDEQFSRIDAGVNALERIRRNLKRMRAAILQAAVTGQLVRMEPDGSAEELLARIMEDRRTSFSRRRHAAAVRPFPSAQPIPPHWVWTSLDALAATPDAITDGPFGSNLKSSHYTADGPRVIRLQNIGDGEFVDAVARISTIHFRSLANHAVEGGDLVCALLGKTLPRACLIPEKLGPAIVKADCPRVRLSRHVDRRFIWAALNAPGIRREVSRRLHGVGRPRLNLGELRELAIPLPPLNEQHRIVEEMDRQLDSIARLDSEIAAFSQLAARLRSSILSAAFHGALGSQSSADEPGSALLERIVAKTSNHQAARASGFQSGRGASS